MEASTEPSLLPELPEFTVASLSYALKKTLETTYGRVRVRGEISGGKRHTSGHFYFSLKDNEALIDGICWDKVFKSLSIQPQDGLEVICQGRITAYTGRSKYQIVVEKIELTGEGSLFKLLEQRKKMLLAEGLFDSSKKKKLPFLPHRIGLITSSTGAVIQDILHRLQDRFPCHVLVWPVAVQGESASKEITEAIIGLNRLSASRLIPALDVLIVARGGGSLEDLWAFNEENVVRAAASSQIPLISAVGHETDTTLIDYAADRRAPTPTAAAEIAMPVRQDLIDQMETLGHRLNLQIQRIVETQQMQVRLLTHQWVSMEQRLESYIQRLDDMVERLDRAHEQRLGILEKKWLQLSLTPPFQVIRMNKLKVQNMAQQFQKSRDIFIQSLEVKVEKASNALENCSYARTLERGFCLAMNEEGQVQRTSQQVPKNASLRLHFKDGILQTRVVEAN